MCKCTCGVKRGEYPSNRERILWNVEDGPDGCWLWTGGFTDYGYGRIYIPGIGEYRAHRLAYETFIGAIPPGLTIDPPVPGQGVRCAEPSRGRVVRGEPAAAA